MTEERAQEIFLDEIDKAINIGIPIPENLDTILTFNRRKTVLGVCCKDRNLCRIELSKYMLDMPERKVRETIAHELCHTCSDDNHGKMWKYYANMFNKYYGYNISRLANKEDSEKFNEISGYKRSEAKYIIQCPVCNRKWNYARRSWAVQCAENGKCKCPICKVTVKRIK